MNKLHDWLKEQGFSFGKQSQQQMNDCDWYAWRRISLEPRKCECNEKLQLVITPCSFRMNDYQSVEIDITGESSGLWWKLAAYSVKPSELMARLPEIESALVFAWNALHYEAKKM